MDQNNLFGDDEGPTTSNALRADSGVSDGNVSLNNTVDGEDETGSDATQILSTGGIGAVESKERHRLMRKGSGGGSGSGGGGARDGSSHRQQQQQRHGGQQQERQRGSEDEELRRQHQRRLHHNAGMTINASSDETSVENTTTTNSGERGGDVVNTNTNNNTNHATREASQTSNMSQGSFEDHHRDNENANNNDNNDRGENNNENTDREHSEDTGVARDTFSNRDRDNNNNNNNNNGSEQPLFNNATELIARAPPMGFRIPGTAAGEGVARAHAAGNVLPDILRAKRVTSLDAEFPIVWDPVALLCLYPGSERSQEAFLKLAQSLKPRREEMPEDVAETANVGGAGTPTVSNNNNNNNNNSNNNNNVTIPASTGGHHGPGNSIAGGTGGGGRGSGLLRERIAPSTQSFNDRSSLNSSHSHGNEREPGAEVVLSPLSTSVREQQQRAAAEAAAAAAADNTTGTTTSGSGELQRTPSMMEVSQTAIGVAAKVELPEGYVAYIVSQEQLPDLAYEAVAKERDLQQAPAATAGGYDPTNTSERQQRRMPGIARERFLADAANANTNTTPTNYTSTNTNFQTIEPLWVIIQTVEPLPAPQPIANVPAPDSRPARGILKGWTASQLGNYSKETGAVAGGAGGITQGATSEREPLHRRRTSNSGAGSGGGGMDTATANAYLSTPLTTGGTNNGGLRSQQHQRQPQVVSRANNGNNVVSDGEYDTDNDSRGFGTSAGSRETDPDSVERDDGSEGANVGGSNISGAVVSEDANMLEDVNANRPRSNVASDEETELTSGISNPSEDAKNKDDVSAVDDDNASLSIPTNEQTQQTRSHLHKIRREPSPQHRSTPSPASSPSSSDATEDDISPSSQGRALAALDAANRNSLVPQTSVNVTRVRKIPIQGARFALLGFEMDHPHVKFLLQKMESLGATHVLLTSDKNEAADKVLDLIVVHPPFLQLLHAKDFTQLEIRDFLRSRRARFALGLRHLELCIENERLLDPRIETAEVFPEGVILVVDDTTLAMGEEIVQKLVKLLGQAAAASAAASAAKGILHYNQEGARENPPWPWAIKLNNDTVQKLMLQKMQIARTDPDKAWRIENCLKLLHAHKATGDRAGRGARVLGIDWEEASHQPIQFPPQEVRDAVKLASRHGATCRAVFLVSENPETVAEARKHSKVVLSGNLHECCEWLEEVIKEMWAETKAARDEGPWVNVLGFPTVQQNPATTAAAKNAGITPKSAAASTPTSIDVAAKSIEDAAANAAARIVARKAKESASGEGCVAVEKDPTPPTSTSGNGGTITRRDSEDSLQNDDKTKRLLMQSRPSNDISPEFQQKSDASLSDKNKHQMPWITGALKTSAVDQKRSIELGAAPHGGDAPMTLSTPQSRDAINPSGPGRNYNISGSAILTNSSQKKKTKTVRFPTTIDDGGTMGAGRRRGRYSPPPSPPRTTSAISGDTADMRDTLSMREGEGEATDVSELDLEGSVDEKPIPAESEGGVVGDPEEEGGGKTDIDNIIDNAAAPANIINATGESKGNEQEETGRKEEHRQPPSSSSPPEKKKRKSPMKNTQPRRESPRKSARQSPRRQK